jgi:hypothetical protein
MLFQQDYIVMVAQYFMQVELLLLQTIATDIMQFAMDIDNGFLYWGKNGTWLNSSRSRKWWCRNRWIGFK